MNFTDRIGGMIVRPGETIEDISKYPNVGEAGLIVGITAIISAISAYLMNSKIIVDYSGVDVGNLEMLNFFTNVMPIVSALIGIFIMWVIVAGIVHLISVALGGEGSFIQLLVVYGYAYIPVMIHAVIGILLLSFVEPITITFTSIGATNNAMGDLASSPFYQASLAIGTLLRLWSIGLVFMGVRYIYGLNINRAFIAVTLPLLSLIFEIVMALLSSSFM